MIFSSEDLCYAVLEHLKDGIDYMTLWQELDQYASFSIQKDISLGLTG
jgi:thiamine biosynthesis protein ThiC